MAARFAYLPVTSPLHDEAAVGLLLAGLADGLAAAGGVRTDAGSARAGGVPVVFVALTGGTERRMLDVWRARQVRAPWEPFIAIAHGGQNSLPAAMEAVARVHQDGGRGRVVYLGGATDERGWNELHDAAAALDARRALTGMRIGVVGTPSDWLVASAPRAEVVARRWGPVLVEVDIAGTLDRLGDATRPRELVRSLTDGAIAIREPAELDIDIASLVQPALADVVHEERLDALTVRCFDLVTDAHTSGCVALAELNDLGIIAGCEGDIVSTVTMAWLAALVEETPWMANPARVDVAGNRVLLAHCTIARSLLSSYRLRSHFESGLGVAIEGDIAADEVTLVRVGGRDMERLWVAEGTVDRIANEEGLCRTQLHVRLDEGDAVDLLRDPLGNHIVTVAGRHAARISAAWELLVADPG